MKRDLCLEFADHTVSTSYETLPRSAIEAAKKSILDTIGVMAPSAKAAFVSSGLFQYPDVTQLNPIEARLLASALNLTSIYRRKAHASATVNRQLFKPGESKDVEVDAHIVGLTCIAIEPTSARFKVSGTTTEVVLELRK